MNAVITRWSPWFWIQQRIVAVLEMFNGVAYVLFLLIIATLFLRPAEIIPALKGLPIYEGLMAGAGIGGLNRMLRRLTWPALIREPVTLCVCGLLVAVVLSHLSHFAFWALPDSFSLFAKVVMFYLLMVSLVDTPRRFRGMLFTICLCGAGMVTLCVIDYVGWHDFECVTPVVDLDEEMAEGKELELVLRMRGTGLFQDPNDISLVIVAMGALCGYFLTNPRASPLRFTWVIPLGILVAALYFTRSRGGLLAGGAAGLTYLAARYGRSTAIVCGLFGALALPVLAGRQGDIDLQGGTGRERIQIWREGLEEIKGASVLFGIGQGAFYDAVGIVAHNAYVHSFVELGLFGGTLFFGCFAFTVLAVYRMCATSDPVIDPELARFTPFAAAMIAGWCTGLFSLSRCYVVPTYLIIGLGAVFTSLMNSQLRPPRFLVCWNKTHLQHLLAGSAALFVGLHVFVKVFAR